MRIEIDKGPVSQCGKPCVIKPEELGVWMADGSPVALVCEDCMPRWQAAIAANREWALSGTEFTH